MQRVQRKSNMRLMTGGKQTCKKCGGSQICVHEQTKRKPAESAAGPKSALMTGESETVRSAVTRLKLASNNGLLVDGQYDKMRNIYDADRFIDKCFLERAQLKNTNNVITEIVKTQTG